MLSKKDKEEAISFINKGLKMNIGIHSPSFYEDHYKMQERRIAYLKKDSIRKNYLVDKWKFKYINEKRKSKTLEKKLSFFPPSPSRQSSIYHTASRFFNILHGTIYMKEAAKSVELGERESFLLCFASMYEYVNEKFVIARFGRKGFNVIWSQFASLVNKGLLTRKETPDRMINGKPQYNYFITEQGRKKLYAMERFLVNSRNRSKGKSIIDENEIK